MQYVWDANKEQANIKKHGVKFDDAIEVFLDDDRIEEIDDRFDYGEERLTIIGMTQIGILFVVAVEKGEDVTRIISARDATKSEAGRYDEARLSSRG